MTAQLGGDRVTTELSGVGLVRQVLVAVQEAVKKKTMRRSG
ncbi:hypothetical protein AB0B21_38580 [Streptomyces rimosus]|nr:hypothetical protein [Streptomyces rimosus]